MKKITTLLMLTFIVSISFAQYTPMTAAGYQFKRILCDSTLHIPSFCGIPTLRNSTAKNGAIAMDTCNFKIYMWTNAAGWGEIIAAGTDTTSLSNRINLKLNISDTATMLSNYLRNTDTTNRFVNAVTKKDDSTITVFKGTSATDITLSIGAAPATPTLQEVTTQGATTTDKVTMTGGYGLVTNEFNSLDGAGEKYSVINSFSESIGSIKLNWTDNFNTSFFNPSLEMVGEGSSSQNIIRIKTDEIALQNPVKGIVSLKMQDTTEQPNLYFPRGDNQIDTLATLRDVRAGGGSSGTVTNVATGYGLSGGPITTTGTLLVDSATLSSKYLRIVDTTDKWVSNISRTIGKDSIIFFIGSTRYAIKDSSGGQNLQQVTDKGATTSNNITVQGITQAIQYKNNSIEFRSTAAEPYIIQTLIPSQGYYGQVDTLPTGSGVLALSVNGVKADTSGNITLSVGGGGTVTSISQGYGIAASPNPIIATGTVTVDTATLSGKYLRTTDGVPYTGATSNLNMGTKNVTANAYFNGFTSMIAAGTTVTLTIDSTPVHLVSGSGGQTFQLPNATTLPKGTTFSFNNNQSSGNISVNNNSGTLVKAVGSGGYMTLELTNNSTAAGTWDAHFQTPANVSWSTNTFDYGGSITSAQWNGTTVAYNRGGTGQSSLFTQGGVAFGSTTTSLGTTAAGTSGQMLVSAGTGTPTWADTSVFLRKTDTSSMLTPYIRLAGTGLTKSSQTLLNNLSTGVSGGQSVVGGTAASNSLTLSSTSNATKGKLLFGTSAYNEVNNRLGIGTASPSYPFHLTSSVTASSAFANLGQINGTLNAAANNDTLIALYVNPTFSVGSFTNTVQLASRFNGNVLMGQLPGNIYTYPPLTLCNNLNANLKTQLSLVNGGGNAGAGSAIDFFTYTDAGNGNPGVRIGAIDDGNFSGDLKIFTKVQGSSGNGSLTEKFQIKGGTGNVLINTTTDAGYKLDVNGTTRMQGAVNHNPTNTAAGTTGNQTINKPSGTVNIAAAGTTVTVTNSLVSATSIVYAIIRTNDATATIKNVVPAAGSFVINLGAAATAEVSIGFFVIN